MYVMNRLLFVALVGTTTLSLAEDHRHHGTHEHGVGHINIAQQDTALDIELESPAINIVGFEHSPNSEADHATLNKAMTRLKDGSSLFLFPKTADCTLQNTNLDNPFSEDLKHSKTHHKHEEEHEHEHKKQTHRDIMVSWHFSCSHPEALDQINVQLFNAFPATTKLQAQIFTQQHQVATELNASHAVLRF